METVITQVRTNGTTFIGGIVCMSANMKHWEDFDDAVARLTVEDAQEDADQILRWHNDTNKVPDFIGTIQA